MSHQPGRRRRSGDRPAPQVRPLRARPLRRQPGRRRLQPGALRGRRYRDVHPHRRRRGVSSRPTPTCSSARPCAPATSRGQLRLVRGRDAPPASWPSRSGSSPAALPPPTARCGAMSWPIRSSPRRPPAPSSFPTDRGAAPPRADSSAARRATRRRSLRFSFDSTSGVRTRADLQVPAFAQVTGPLDEGGCRVPICPPFAHADRGRRTDVRVAVSEGGSASHPFDTVRGGRSVPRAGSGGNRVPCDNSPGPGSRSGQGLVRRVRPSRISADVPAGVVRDRGSARPYPPPPEGPASVLSTCAAARHDGPSPPGGAVLAFEPVALPVVIPSAVAGSS